MKGYICLPRDFILNPIWAREPCDRFMAFIELLSMASYTERTITLDNVKIPLGKGELASSVSNLAKRWKRSRHYVYDALNYLDSRGLIEVREDYNTNIIRIVNWETYQ